MKPIQFKESNCTYAEHQSQYQPLPVFKTKDGQVVSCWALTFWERINILFTGRLWWSVLTFNNPLQPQTPLITKPDLTEI